MAVKITRWDASDYLETWEDIAAYLRAVLEDGDPSLLQRALKDIVKSPAFREIVPNAEQTQPQ
ncbi:MULTISPECIES: DNA-binding protein [unclassified Actinotignum]|uniref:helix-turn-helix domain-containing transcriptional regulator n=1 Tax=unclassified Actinotignum TaxID=2632702 RepID=UPI003F48C7D5